MLLCAVHCGTALCGTGFTVGWLLMPMLRFNYIWISCYSASVLPKTTMNGDGIEYADDDILPVRRLIRMRAPSLAIGLVLGVLLSFITSRFEQVLEHNIRVAFFIPFIVYMADAVGTQTQSIYVRDLKSGKAQFHHYLIKETIIGFVLALTSSIIAAIITWVWLASQELSLAVSLGTFGAVLSAPLIALLVAEALQLEHSDPAVGAGPIATVIQDTVSVVIYGIIASLIIL